MKTPAPQKKLGELKVGERGLIVSVGESGAIGEDLTRRLLEIGLLEGSLVELVHEAPFGSDPIAVRVRGALIALRRSEANEIQVTQALGEPIHE